MRASGPRCLGLSLLIFAVSLPDHVAYSQSVPTEVAGIAKALVAKCTNGQVLVKDTTVPSGVRCATPGGGGGTPGGDPGTIQFNDSGVLGGVSGSSVSGSQVTLATLGVGSAPLAGSGTIRLGATDTITARTGNDDGDVTVLGWDNVLINLDPAGVGIEMGDSTSGAGAYLSITSGAINLGAASGGGAIIPSGGGGLSFLPGDGDGNGGGATLSGGLGVDPGHRSGDVTISVGSPAFGATSGNIVLTTENGGLTIDGAPGITASGTSCTITAITHGIITAATCTP